MGYQVTGVFCVEGNPTKAWAGTTGDDDTEHVPDDVWEEQVHDFEDIDEAKDFIRGLHPQMSTHVVLQTDDGEVLVEMDAEGDHLDDAAPGVERPSQAPPQPPPGENVVDESLTPYESQGV
jgi:hypothetical protein